MNTFTAVVLLGCMASCLSAFENICEDHSAGYTPNMFWMSEPNNCHLYVVCEPHGAGLYKVNKKSCGNLYWSEDARTCVREIPDAATCNREATALPTDFATTEFPSPADFCDNRCFLNFHFENNFADSSCTNAVASVATGNIEFSASTHGQGALFDGTGYLDIPAMRGIFSGHYMTAFSVSLFFKTSNRGRNELIFDNGDKSDVVSILFGYMARKNTLSAQIYVSANVGRRRDTKMIYILMPLKSPPTEWTHAVYVYDNNTLSLTINGNVTKTKSFENLHNKHYTINDMDEPLSLGGRSNGDYYFTGMIDEFKVFKRGLSASEIIALYHDIF